MSAQTQMRLPFVLRGREQIQWWADRYPRLERDKDDRVSDMVQTACEEKGYLSPGELYRLAFWKSGKRTFPDLDDNDPGSIEKLTAQAIADENIEPLLDIKGVKIPTASSVMHFVFPNSYPVIDRRALYTLLGEERTANPALWRKYLPKCLELKERYQVTLRILDRALWEYANEALAWRKLDEIEKAYPRANGP